VDDRPRVFETLRLMAEKDAVAPQVVEGDRVGGMISERDYACRVILIGRSSKEAAVRRIMTHNVRWTGACA
jgi:predicted transcriptional regulator